MAKFTLYLELHNFGDDDPVSAVAQQNNLSEDRLRLLIDKFVNMNSVTLQFDSEEKTCTVLKVGQKGVNDFDPNVQPKTIEDIEDEKRWRAQIAEHQQHIVEATASLKKEKDKKSSYAAGLFKYIEEERQAIKEIKEYLEV